MSGAELIAAERARQIESEGWTPEHDDEHRAGELCAAALVYAQSALTGDAAPHPFWPWAREWFKSATPIRMLVKAGALIAAEIDRRLRDGESA